MSETTVIIEPVAQSSVEIHNEYRVVLISDNGGGGGGGGGGEPGADGKSAYEVAVDNGFVGTEAEWLASLVGPAGADGADGLSAYEVAVAEGFPGTLSEWLASLQGEPGADGEDGTPGAGLAIRGTLPSQADLPASGVAGDGWLIGGFLWLWDATGAFWFDAGKIEGPQGPAGNDGADGSDGADGLSAYQIAVSNGYIGTEIEWLESLHGRDGVDGTDGADGADGTDGTNGTDGVDGADGLSAYEVALANGFIGSEQDWLDSLVGAPGADGADGADGQDGVDGADGLSAYEVAVADGFPGSLADWLASLKGEPGADGVDGNDGTDGQDGASAYEVALAGGFVGSETEWLASLQGEPGADGEDGADAPPMETVEIGDLTDAGAPEDTDIVPVARTAGVFRLTLASIAAWVLGKIVPGSGIRVSAVDGVVTLRSGGVRVVSITASTTLNAATHGDAFLRFDNSSDITITIPTDANGGFDPLLHTQIECATFGTGKVTFVAASGGVVTLLRSTKISNITDGRWEPQGLKHVGANEWLLFGQMGAA